MRIIKAFLLIVNRWKDAQQAELALKEIRENEEEGNAMKVNI